MRVQSVLRHLFSVPKLSVLIQYTVQDTIDALDANPARHLQSGVT